MAIAEFKNGGFSVRIDEDGTKTRTAIARNPVPEFPESMDVKITNDCDAGCAYCHEMSVPGAPSFVVDDALRLFKDIPDGVELAIGGGNPLTRLQDIKWLDRMLAGQRGGYRSPIMNITINSRHLHTVKKYDLLGFRAVGISYMRGLHDKIVEFIKEKSVSECQHVVHVIAGVQTIDDMKNCLRDFDRVLVLGYKKFGRGADFNTPTIDASVNKWREAVGDMITTASFAGKILAFDNLAVEQLGIQRFFTDENWDKVYMGDDGQFSMYLDLVKMEYAKASFAPERFPIGKKDIKTMFAHIRNL